METLDTRHVSCQKGHYVYESKTRSKRLNMQMSFIDYLFQFAESASDIDQRFLVYELKILIHIGWHPNVVNLLGACTKGKLKKNVPLSHDVI